ncbi:hypersensitive response-inducing protein [Diaporthe helianthi]|uniref:Hypersensitive response-inducing protein n=1 Tax=Diaporthe helianthi TaxID=158607 RepID=A0A2P5I805_DIAHE|nr:hypersensitive response-inducing protein [Diaporthe helianthi]
MQFSAAILAVAAASMASAEAVFKISGFSASCIPHSAQCVYEFGALKPGTMQTEPQPCRAQVVGTDGTLPEIAQGTCGDSTSLSFTVTKADGGLVFAINERFTPSSVQTSKHTIPAAELEMQQTGASSQQVYKGPAAFDTEF